MQTEEFNNVLENLTVPNESPYLSTIETIVLSAFLLLLAWIIIKAIVKIFTAYAQRPTVNNHSTYNRIYKPNFKYFIIIWSKNSGQLFKLSKAYSTFKDAEAALGTYLNTYGNSLAQDEYIIISCE